MKYACEMRKFLRFGLVLAFSFVSAVVPANSAVKLGDACKSLGKTTSVNGSTLICTKSGSKLVWIKRSKADSYDAAFANAFLAEAKRNAAKILEDAKLTANQISSPPYCSTGNSSARASIGSDGNLRSLVFENPGICDITVRASASFRCDSPLPPSKNTVRSTGVFPLRAKEKLIFSNWSYYFPQVNLECRLLTGSSGLAINLSRDGQEPSVMTLTSSYSGNFNQVEASKRADQHLKTEKARAEKVVSDAKKPALIAKAWKEAAEAKIAADIQAIANAAAEVDAKAAADAKAAVDAKIAADVKAAADAKASADQLVKATYDSNLGKPCVVGVSCPIGSTGPGGGIVFYDAGIQQWWGRYLEVAPNVWAGRRLNAGSDLEGLHDPYIDWCAGSFKDQATMHSGWTQADLAKLGVESGKGKWNTEMLLTFCPYNRDNEKVIGFVNQYNNYNGIKNGIGKTDWYIPSKDELNELCKYVNYQATGNSQIQCKPTVGMRKGFGPDGYWSSSQFDESQAWFQSFVYGSQFPAKKDYKFSIRIVRAF